jgi:ABC-type Fe3+-hydroxamate transport system substrate-binding protein
METRSGAWLGEVLERLGREWRRHEADAGTRQGQHLVAVEPADASHVGGRQDELRDDNGRVVVLEGTDGELLKLSVEVVAGHDGGSGGFGLSGQRPEFGDVTKLFGGQPRVAWDAKPNLKKLAANWVGT